MAKLDVSKWQAARKGPLYTPVMQFYLRMIRMALFEALRVQGSSPYVQGWDASGAPMLDDGPDFTSRYRLWDEAIMARHWIARPAPNPQTDREGWLLSFDAACEALGLNADHERVWMLDKIDAAADFDTDEVWARVEFLTANPPDESVEPLFEAPRVVPALDQGSLFALLEAA